MGSELDGDIKKKDEEIGLTLTNLKGFDFPIQRPRCERGRVNVRGNDDIVNISIELLNLNRCKKSGHSLDLRLKPTFRRSKLLNKQPDRTIEVETKRTDLKK